MRSLITGDLHLSHNTRDEYRFEFMVWFATLASKRKPDRIIIAGDLTEEKDRHPSILVNRVVEHVNILAEIAPVVVVEGNHDYKDEGQAFFRFLSRIPNTRWIEKPTVLGDQLLCLPHTNNHKRDWRDIDLEAYSTIVCHQTFNGANVGFGRSLDGIELDVLPRGSTTFCGDVHVPQKMGHVVYIGAPYHVDFGDDYKARVIMLDERGWSSIDTSKVPQKRAIRLSSQDLEIEPGSCNARDVVEIKIDVDDMSDWVKVRDHVAAQADKLELRVWAIKPVMTKRAVRRRHKVADAQSDHAVLEAFAKRHGLSDRTLAVGEKLL